METNHSKVITLKELIKEKGLTQRGLHKKTGIPEITINTWVAGKYIPTLDNAVRVAIALEVDLKTLAQSIGIDVNGLPDN